MDLAFLTHHSRTVNHLGRSLLTLSLTLTACYAQSQSTASAQVAAISGTVTDMTGAVIPKANVRLDTLGHPTLQTTTDSVGHFEVQAEPGDYTLKASAYGFEIYAKKVHLIANTPATERIELLVGGGVCECCVTVGPPLELLNASLDLLLPLKPLPPYQLSTKTLKHLQK